MNTETKQQLKVILEDQDDERSNEKHEVSVQVNLDCIWLTVEPDPNRKAGAHICGKHLVSLLCDEGEWKLRIWPVDDDNFDEPLYEVPLADPLAVSGPHL